MQQLEFTNKTNTRETEEETATRKKINNLSYHF
jgi:hypothetical protein